MKFMKNWKRIIAGFMAAAMVFLSIDRGCITALAAEIQEQNDNQVMIEAMPTGYIPLEGVSIDIDDFSGEIYDYQELANRQAYSAVYNNEWDKYSTNYFYNQLNDEWRQVWDGLDALCLNYLTSDVDAQTVSIFKGYYLDMITLPENTLMEDGVKFASLFMASNPQYYFLGSGYLYYPDDTKTYMRGFCLGVYDKFADGEARLNETNAFKTAIESVLNEEKISTTASESEKLKYLHDYVVNKVEYNYDITTDYVITDEEDELSISQSAYSALCMDTTVCAGYAEALQLLCNGLDVDAIIVTSSDHMWNKVRINDSWYNVDPTWADAGVGNPIYYDYYARNDATYDDTSDVQYLSHQEEALWTSYLPLCTLDTVPKENGTVAGTFPEITEQVAAPEVIIMAAGTNEETGVQQYMVGVKAPTVVDLSNPIKYYYTVDGTEPSVARTKSTKYSNSFYVEGDYTIKMVAAQNGYLDSEVAIFTNVQSLPSIEDVSIKSHFYQKQTFIWKAIGENVAGYTIKVFNGADSTQIGEAIDVPNGNTAFYHYDTSALADGTSIYYEIYGYTLGENDEKVSATEIATSAKSSVNQLNMPLDVDVKWHVTTSDGSNLLVVNVEEDTKDKLCLWYFTDKNGINSLNNFTLDMTDGVTEFKYSLEKHGVAYDEVGYVFITDEAKSTAFQENGFVVGGEYQAPELKPIEDVQLESTGDSVVLKAEITEESLMKNFNYKYQWYEAEDDTSIGVAIEGATFAEYEVRIGSFDEKYYYCEVTAEYLTKNVYQTQNAMAEEGVGAKHTRVLGALYNTNITYDDIEEQVYDGNAKTPALVLKNGLNDSLVLGDDYTLEYLDNINAGKATIKVDFINDYASIEDAVVNFTIKPKTASKETLEFTDVVTDKEYIYNGSAHVPNMIVKDPDRNVILVPEGDYDIAYKGNVDAGTATITLKFKGNYDGRVVIDFEILPKSAQNVTVASIEDQTFTGRAIIPALSIKDGETELVVDKDYTVSCVKNTHVGVADVTIEFIGNYKGTKTTKFDIVPRNASEVSVTSIENQEYTGLEIEPTLDVVYRNGDYVTVLTKESNYTVAYSNNIALGTATITLTFDGDFTGTKVVNFEIVPRNAENLTYGQIESYEYDGNAHEPELVIKNGEIPLAKGTDYIVAYSDNVNAGTAKATVQFDGFEGCSGNYTGTKELTFLINPKAATNCTATLETLEGYTFNGSEIKPGVIVKDGETVLVEDTEEVKGDYKVDYDNNINAGEAKVIITFVNNYTGETTLTFQIERKAITEADIEIEAIADQTYNGTEIIPEIVVKDKVTGNTLKKDYDYTVTGSNNVFVGTDATLVISLNLEGNYIYTGEDMEVNFAIVPRDAMNVKISAIPEQKHTGSAITPTLEVKDGDIVLIAGVDYTVTYENNIEVGTEAKVIVSFCGNFTGDDKEAFFTIIDPVPTSITSSVFTINQSNGYISKITVGTTKYTLWSTLNEKDYIEIYDKSGNTVGGDKVLTTGMTAGIIDEGTVTKRYTIIVTGDTNGDGKINITDMIAVKACTLKKSDLSGAYEKAGDVNGDGKINITDFIKIKATTLKKDTITGVSVN